MSHISPVDAAINAAKAALVEHIAANPGIGTEAAIAFLVARMSPTLPSTEVVAAAPAVHEPKVSARDSISADGHYIYCMVDGAKLRMLKRYIKRFNLTPETYRARFNLPDDYPMTAPGYSLQKRGEALAVGLGTHENKAGHNMHRELEAA